MKRKSTKTFIGVFLCVALLSLCIVPLSLRSVAGENDYIHGEFVIITPYDWEDDFLQEQLTFMPEYTYSLMMHKDAEEGKEQMNMYHIILADSSLHDTVYGSLLKVDGLTYVGLNYIYTLISDYVEPLYIKGDLTGDGEIDSSDAALLLKYDAGSVELSDAQLTAADYDGDGSADSNDAALILKYDAGV